MATEAAHTPGPWELVRQSRGGPIVAQSYETGDQINPTGLRIVAQMFQRGDSLVEDKANAALIAAAPDLYNALKRMIIGIRLGGDVADAFDAACAALEKAEGK